MAAPTSIRSTAMSYVVADCSLDLLVAVETLACVGRTMTVAVEATDGVDDLLLVGTTVGVVGYLMILGLPTTTIEKDLRTNGPPDCPRHLHLSNVTMTDRHGTNTTMEAYRVRLEWITSYEMHRQMAS